MTGFPGQLTTRNLSAMATGVWQLVNNPPYVVKAFFKVKVRAYAVFKGWVS